MSGRGVSEELGEAAELGEGVVGSVVWLLRVAKGERGFEVADLREECARREHVEGPLLLVRAEERREDGVPQRCGGRHQQDEVEVRVTSRAGPAERAPERRQPSRRQSSR